MRKSFAKLGAVACGMALSLSLAGCGGASSGGAAQSGDAAEPSVSGAISGDEEAAQTEGATVAEEEAPALTYADIAGWWKLDSEEGDDSSEAAFVVYRFKKDGTFILRAVVADSKLDREGTYEIRDDKVYVNVPEGASSEVNGTTYTANEIKDAEITFDGDKLSAEGISDNKTIVAHKITKEEYRELVAKAAEFAPKSYGVGDTISGDGYTVTINSFEFREEIYPSDTSGYYNYYADEEGKTYLVADVTYTNDGTEYATPGWSTAAFLFVGENKYQAQIDVDGGSNTSQSYSIDAKETSRVIVFASIPDAAIEEGASIQLTWSFPKDGSLLNTYYKSSNDNDFFHIVK